MNTCYRGMPKFVGAFFDAVYQHPMMMVIVVVSITALAGSWWYKASKNAE